MSHRRDNLKNNKGPDIRPLVVTSLDPVYINPIAFGSHSDKPGQ